jgi:hypothetical protein
VDADGKISDAMGNMRDYMTTEVPFKQKRWRMGFRLDENTLVGLRRRKQKCGRHSPRPNARQKSDPDRDGWHSRSGKPAVEACFSMLAPWLPPQWCEARPSGKTWCQGCDAKVGIGGLACSTGSCALGKCLFSATTPTT